MVGDARPRDRQREPLVNPAAEAHLFVLTSSRRSARNDTPERSRPCVVPEGPGVPYQAGDGEQVADLMEGGAVEATEFVVVGSLRSPGAR